MTPQSPSDARPADPVGALAAAARDAALPADGRLLAVLGDPIAHSLSPAIHGAALRSLALPHRYVAVRCGVDGLGAVLAAMRALPVLGLNLTAPLKEAALRHLDALTPLAHAVGAVNTVARDGDRLVGHNTDVRGFLRALREETGFDPNGRRALLLGAGGAARAVAAGLLDAGAAHVLVLARRPDRAERLAAALATASIASRAVVIAGAGFDDPPPEVVAASELVVQCTPLGVGTAEGSAAWAQAASFFERLPWDAWSGRAVAADLVYRPARTPFVARAEAAGCTTTNGLGMLIHQAAEAFTIWTGLDAPLDAMRDAAG